MLGTGWDRRIGWPGGSASHLPWRLPSAATRLGWGVADQAMSSLSNFAVGVFVARGLGPVDFGAFSLAYVSYAVVLNASRGLATDPLLVRHSGEDTGPWHRAVAGAVGTATAVGAVVGVLCVIGGAWLGGSVGAAFLALGITLPGLMLQDSWRFAFFSGGRGKHAFVNDLIWFVTLVPALLAIQASGAASVLVFTLAWGGTGGVAGLVGWAQARLAPAPARVWGWLREHRDLAPRYLVENLSLSLASQLRYFGVGAVAGLVAVGSLRGMEVLVGPFFVLSVGLGMVAVPEGARMLRRGPGRIRRFCLTLGGVQAGAAALWGMVLLLLPERLGTWVLGSVWHPASQLILPVCLTVVIGTFGSAAGTGLRALGAARRSLRARLVNSAAFLIGGVAGAAVNGAYGSAWGVAIAETIGALFWWRELGLGLREDAAPRATLTEAVAPG